MKSVIHKENNNLMYFLTFVVKNWYYLFDRNNRFSILSNTLKFFQENKGLKIYGYVFMLNHIHLIIQSNDVIGFVRDFKRWTSRELKSNLIKYWIYCVDAPLFEKVNFSTIHDNHDCACTIIYYCLLYKIVTVITSFDF